MLNILANTYTLAARMDRWDRRWGAPSHWRQGERFDNRRDAEIEAHLTGRRRD